MSWRDRKSRALVLNDLLGRKISIDEKLMTAETFLELRCKYEAVFIEEKVYLFQFKRCLKIHREQVSQQREWVVAYHAAAVCGRTIFLRQKRNSHGKLVFGMHPAKEFLRMDIEAKAHIGKISAKFQRIHREYQACDANIFKHRIYKKIKYDTFVRYLEK